MIRQRLTEAVPSWKTAVTLSPVVREKVGQKGLRERRKAYVTCHHCSPPLLSPFQCLHSRKGLQNSWQLTGPAGASHHVGSHCRAVNPAAEHRRLGEARSEGPAVREGQQQGSAGVRTGRRSPELCWEVPLPVNKKLVFSPSGYVLQLTNVALEPCCAGSEALGGFSKSSTCVDFFFFLSQKNHKCAPVCAEAEIVLWALCSPCPPSPLLFFVCPLHREGRSSAGVWWSRGIIKNVRYWCWQLCNWEGDFWDPPNNRSLSWNISEGSN